jgi:site-specific recombinase XerD
VKESGVEIIPAVLPSDFPVPAIIASGGGKASEHFLEFFAATIRNKDTRAAYVQAAAQFFRWCEEYDLKLAAIRPLHVSAYIESKPMTAPSIKQHLAALRGLFNWLVIKQVVPDNPPRQQNSDAHRYPCWSQLRVQTEQGFTSAPRPLCQRFERRLERVLIRIRR